MLNKVELSSSKDFLVELIRQIEDSQKTELIEKEAAYKESVKQKSL